MMINIKQLIFIFSVMIISIMITVKLTKNHINQNIIEPFMRENKNIELYLKNSLESMKLKNDFKRIDSILKPIVKLTPYSEIELVYSKFFFTKNELFLNSNNIINQNWVISDVTTDIKKGHVKKISEDLFLFIPSNQYLRTSGINVKFQALKDHNVQDSISTLHFYRKIKSANVVADSNKFAFLKQLFWFDQKNFEGHISLFNGYDKYADIYYIINKENFNEQIITLLKEMFTVYIIIMGLFLMMFLLITSSTVKRRQSLTKESINSVNIYLENMINNDFSNNQPNFAVKEFDILLKNLHKISLKYATMINDLYYDRNKKGKN